MAPPNQNVEPGIPLPDKIAAALARFREAIPVNFDSGYVDSYSKNQPRERFERNPRQELCEQISTHVEAQFSEPSRPVS